MTRIELATPLGVGGILGLSAGLAMGIAGGAVGAGIGLVAGTLVGLVAGTAIYRDDGRQASRARELDEIIGVSGGDLGAAPVSMPPPPEPPPAESWLAEWLTPPPPVAG